MTHSTSVSGSSVVTGLPMKLDISSGDVSEALKPILDRIFRKILEVLPKNTPALLADIRDHGILMTGGASCLKGLDMMITRTTGIPAYVVEYSVFCQCHRRRKCPGIHGYIPGFPAESALKGGLPMKSTKKQERL